MAAYFAGPGASPSWLAAPTDDAAYSPGELMGASPTFAFPEDDALGPANPLDTPGGAGPGGGALANRFGEGGGPTPAHHGDVVVSGIAPDGAVVRLPVARDGGPFRRREDDAIVAIVTQTSGATSTIKNPGPICVALDTLARSRPCLSFVYRDGPGDPRNILFCSDEGALACPTVAAVLHHHGPDFSVCVTQSDGVSFAQFHGVRRVDIVRGPHHRSLLPRDCA